MRPDNVTGKVRKRAEAFGRVDPDRAEREELVKRSRKSKAAPAPVLAAGGMADLAIFGLAFPAPPLVAERPRAGLGLGLGSDLEMSGMNPAASPAATLSSPEAGRAGSARSSRFSDKPASPYDIHISAGRVSSPRFGAGAAAGESAMAAPVAARVRAVAPLRAQDRAPLPAATAHVKTWTDAVREPLPRSFAAPQIGLNLAAPARREGFIPTGIPLSGARGIFYVPKAPARAAEPLESESIGLGFEF